MVHAERSVDSNVVPPGSAAEFSHSLGQKQTLPLIPLGTKHPSGQFDFHGLLTELRQPSIRQCFSTRALSQV